MPFDSRGHSVALIGMPGAGKSTVGVILAKALAMDFVDSDLLIQVREQRPLQAILEAEGYAALRQIEQQVLLSLAPMGCVVATGGSAVYGEDAMGHLAAHGPVVFLDVPLPSLEQRVGDMSQRGIAAVPGTTLAALATERVPLYRSCATLTVAADAPPSRVVDTILNALA